MMVKTQLQLEEGEELKITGSSGKTYTIRERTNSLFSMLEVK